MEVLLFTCFYSCFHVWLTPAGGISECEAGLSRAYGLLGAVGVYTSWSIDAVSAKHRKLLCSPQTTSHNTDFYTWRAQLRPHQRSICLSTPAPHLYSPPFFFISIFHLLPLHPPLMLLSFFLSLYLNITPYLAGVASRHSNRTVQSPWGLWDIVSCWNRTVCVCVCECAVFIYFLVHWICVCVRVRV